jgi:glutathione peroxidase-family protein
MCPWKNTGVSGILMKIYDYKLMLVFCSGKVVLIVNVASKCGFTKGHYEQLEPLYKKYKDDGFVIAAFPCNQFNSQVSSFLFLLS